MLIYFKRTFKNKYGLKSNKKFVIKKKINKKSSDAAVIIN